MSREGRGVIEWVYVLCSGAYHASEPVLVFLSLEDAKVFCGKGYTWEHEDNVHWWGDNPDRPYLDVKAEGLVLLENMDIYRVKVET